MPLPNPKREKILQKRANPQTNVLNPESKQAKSSFEEVPVQQDDYSDDEVFIFLYLGFIQNAIAETLAIGAEFLNKKKKSELIDNSYNSNINFHLIYVIIGYSFNDPDNLPDWFLDDENQHNKPQIPVTKAQVDFFKEQYKAINARPIKKIAEAIAKKKMRALKKWESIKSKAQMIADNPDATPQTKLKDIQKLYARKDKKRAEEKHYVITNKAGRTIDTGNRKKGSSIKKVDSVMKKEKRILKDREKKNGGKRRSGGHKKR